MGREGRARCAAQGRAGGARQHETLRALLEARTAQSGEDREDPQDPQGHAADGRR